MPQIITDQLCIFNKKTGHRSLQINYVFSTKRQQVGDLKQALEFCALVIMIYRHRSLDLAV